MAYKRDYMSLENRETFLHSQLQKGLCYDLMKSPAVSGSQTCKEFFRAAKNEDKCQLELQCKQQYHRQPGHVPMLFQLDKPPDQVESLSASNISSNSFLSRPVATVGRQDLHL